LAPDGRSDSPVVRTRRGRLVSRLLDAVRRAATLPGLRRLTEVDALLRISFALRALLVTESARFVANELRPGMRPGRYRLRGSPVRVVLRHHTSDVMVLDEVFAQSEYEPPAEAEAALRAVERPLRVIDLGANIGLFGAFILQRFPDASILAVEADPANADLHADTIAANPGADWTLLRAAAGATDGRARFAAGGFATSRLAEPDEPAISVETVDALPLLAAGDFLKIDIEGGEWAILADPRWNQIRAPAVVLEYHRPLCPEVDPATTAEAALREAGYKVLPGRYKSAYGAGVVWGYRPVRG
jgi:FkbM family methyltransferase